MPDPKEGGGATRRLPDAAASPPTSSAKGSNILIVEDDDDDYYLTMKAFAETFFNAPTLRLKDGRELMEFLRRWMRRPPAHGAADAQRLLILLDLNMPRKDGREALREIKSHPSLKRLPVIVLTTSRADKDIAAAYDLGANSFVRKPFGYGQYVEAVAAIKKFWLDTAELPLGTAGTS